MRSRVGTRIYGKLPKNDTSHPQRGRTPVLKAVQQSLRADTESGALSVDSEDHTVSAAGRRLPLSPVMSVKFLESLQTWKGPKDRARPLPVGRFRHLMHANLYARMLAEPARYCSITRARLPRSFLQPFRPITNDFIKKSWWIPYGAVPEVYARTADRPDDDTTRQLSTGPIAWTLLNREVLTPVPDGPRERAAISRRLLVPKQWRTAKLPGDEAPVFREGMSRVMLETMRERIAESLAELAALSEEGGKYILPLSEVGAGQDLPEDHTPFTIRGCILYTDPEMPEWGMMAEGGEWRANKERRQALNGRQRAPGPYATMKIGYTKYNAQIPVHNLLYLLGKERLEELRENSSLLRDNRMLMLARAKTDNTQKNLWKLQGFLAQTAGGTPTAEG